MWSQRLTVALGALSGLTYLHTSDADTHKPVVLHGNVKPSNILLDLNLNPRLSDGGLGKLDGRPWTSIGGTNGFMDEYYTRTGRFDVKSDTYSMGVTLLIILTGWPVFDEELGDITGRCEVDGRQVMTIVDQRAEWPPEVAREMHKVAMALTERNRSHRMSVRDAREIVQRVVDRHLPSAPTNGREISEVERECLICMSAPRRFRFGECGHSVLCRECMDIFMSRSQPQCPTCRMPVYRQHVIEGGNVAHRHTKSWYSYILDNVNVFGLLDDDDDDDEEEEEEDADEEEEDDDDDDEMRSSIIISDDDEEEEDDDDEMHQHFVALAACHRTQPLRHRGHSGHPGTVHLAAAGPDQLLASCCKVVTQAFTASQAFLSHPFWCAVNSVRRGIHPGVQLAGPRRCPECSLAHQGDHEGSCARSESKKRGIQVRAVVFQGRLFL
jgi:serine/threonine protein kinase